jgi:hypothetical protein
VSNLPGAPVGGSSGKHRPHATSAAPYAPYVADPPPARSLTQSGFLGFDLEVDAVLVAAEK